jgi:hypothetical protein
MATYSGARASGLLEPIIAKIMVARAMTCCPTDSMSLEVGTEVERST